MRDRLRRRFIHAELAILYGFADLGREAAIARGEYVDRALNPELAYDSPDSETD